MSSSILRRSLVVLALAAGVTLRLADASDRAVVLPDPQVDAPLVKAPAEATAVIAGGIWGAIPGILRAKFGSHEVINTIMLNFIGIALVSYFTQYYFKVPGDAIMQTAEIGKAVDPNAHCVLICDGAGWHQSGERLTVPQFQARIQDCLERSRSKEPGQWLEVVNWFQQDMLPIAG